MLRNAALRRVPPANASLLASSPPLYKWAPKLPRLRRLELWDGETLAMTEVQQAIHAHCPYFSALSIYVW